MGKVTGEEGWISLGPWGPQGSQRSRSKATYKADGPVMEMTVHYRELGPDSDTESIDAISFQSESCDGTLIGCSEMIGSSHGKMTRKVRIDSSIEQLLFISLTYNTFYLTSLTFHTNRNKYGPIGPFDEKDTPYSTPRDRGDIVGFHGYGEVDSGNRLIAIGVFVKPEVKSLHSIQDPYARSSTDKKREEELKSKIKELEDESVMKNEVLRKRSEEMEKAVVHLQKREEELKEEIKELKGEIKEQKSETREVKKEIKDAETKNKAMEKKVDDLQKIVEEFKIENKELKKEMEEVAAENEVLKQRNEAREALLKQRNEVMEALLKQRSEVMSNIKVRGAIPLGPWGGQGGSFWVYMTNVSPIMEITLRCGEIIDSVLFRNYGRLNGDVVGCSEKFGGTGGHNHETISINSSEEQLRSISLTTYNEVYISSLCFHSNRNRYGPYGRVRGPPVSIPIEEGAVLVGFHGRSGIYLDAIGVIVAHKVLNS